MCGVAGLVSIAAPNEEVGRQVAAMGRQLVHRGPDDEGLWVEGGVGLAHRRLSILDLSPRGHQPMVSGSGRWVLVYNGEVYNYRTIRAELETKGHTFEGGSDTEVLLAGVEEWGLRSTLERSNGMFALALWDRRERSLTLARDRLGKKPLYYGWAGSSFVFASELKALRTVPELDTSLDCGALASYFRFKAIPGSASVFRSVRRVEPGAMRHLALPASPGTAPKLERFWNPAMVAAQPRRSWSSDAEMLDELERLIEDAVRVRLVSDVPLGAFLSGGVDSSLVVALMQRLLDRPARTFSIGFDVPGWDEAPHARAVAEHLGTDHTELYLSPEDARAVIPELAGIYDEPFADVSQIPMLLVSRLAREHVTVALSGDGGDELFAGYPRYSFTDRLWSKVAPLNHSSRVAASLIVGAARRALGARTGGWMDQTALARTVDAHRARLLEHLLGLVDPGEFYRYSMSMWREDRALVLGEPARRLPPMVGPPQAPYGLVRPGELGAYLDLVGYLPDDILVKVDRASMAASLEARSPLLDHRVVNMAWSIPYEEKVRDGRLKWPLQALVRRHLPDAVMDRPKMGFGVPIGEWLRGPLREWADDLLDETAMRRGGYLDAELVQTRWCQHRSGSRDWAPEIWAVLMFQAWLGEVSK